jgi:hypothetical protein
MLKGVLVALVALGMPMGAAIAATTATTLVTSDQATVYGQLFTLTAKVTPSGGGVATGTVTFTDETNAVLGSAALNESGVASLDISTLAVGIHSITATFPGTTAALKPVHRLSCFRSSPRQKRRSSLQQSGAQTPVNLVSVFF